MSNCEGFAQQLPSLFGFGNHRNAMKFANFYLQFRLLQLTGLESSQLLGSRRLSRRGAVCLAGEGKVLVNRFLFDGKALISAGKNGHTEDRWRRHYRNYLRCLNSVLNFYLLIATRWGGMVKGRERASAGIGARMYAHR